MMLMTTALLLTVAAAPAANDYSTAATKHNITADVVSVDTSARTLTVRPLADTAADMAVTTTSDVAPRTSAVTTTSTTTTTTAPTTAAPTMPPVEANPGTTPDTGATAPPTGGRMTSTTTSTATAAAPASGPVSLGPEAGTFVLAFQAGAKLDKLKPGDRVEITCKGSSISPAGASGPFADCAEIAKLKKVASSSTP